MRKILFSIITVFCLSFFFFLFTPDTYAVSFPADYDVTYTIGTDGVTQVRENIVITNETDTQYPSQYTLALEGVSIENIQAADGAGVLETIVEDRDDFTLITVNFNEIVIGRGNQLSWSLQYQSADIVEKKGTITEVSLPQIQPDERISSYRITVISPVELGELDYSDPLPVSYERDESTRRLSYSFENPNEPISVLMAFGTTQLVDMELHYHLENTQHDRRLIEVALPPSQHS